MQELNSRECQALLDILLGVEEKGRKKPVKERPVNFVRFFGGGFEPLNPISWIRTDHAVIGAELGILAIKEADAADAGKGGARL